MKKLLKNITFVRALIILLVLLIIFVVINLLFSSSRSPDNQPIGGKSGSEENFQQPPLYGTDKDSSVQTLLKALPVITDDCLIDIINVKDDPTLVVYLKDANVQLDQCGASLFLKEYQFYLANIKTKIEIGIPGDEGVGGEG